MDILLHALIKLSTWWWMLSKVKQQKKLEWKTVMTFPYFSKPPPVD